MVDIHSHILPGVDDGSPALETSLAMLEMAAADGITDIVATPHANHEYAFQPLVIEEKIRELSAHMGDRIRIHRGCDLHLSFDNIQDALANPTRYTINHRRYLLVEFSDLLIPKTSGEVFFRMLSAGIVPIITHPERNHLLHTRIEMLEAWVQSGCLLQVTALSFFGRFGKQAKSFGDELMRRGLVHIVASDAHDTEHRPPQLREAYAHVVATHGSAVGERLFVTNPMATLIGDPIVHQDPPPPEPKKPWYRFW